MYKGEQDKSPHQQVMDLADIHIPAQKRNDPSEQPGQKRAAHCSVHPEPRKTLQQENQECNKIDEACQRVMTDRIDPLVRHLEYINFDNIQDFLPLAPFQRDKIIPPRKFIPCKSPIDSKNEVKEEKECSYKMDKTDCPEPKIEVGFGALHKGRRITDQITGNTK